MKYITDYGHIEFIPETERERKLTRALYESLPDENKRHKIFGEDIININEQGDLYIITYI
jgi:hypothetical protein